MTEETTVGRGGQASVKMIIHRSSLKNKSLLYLGGRKKDTAWCISLAYGSMEYICHLD